MLRMGEYLDQSAKKSPGEENKNRPPLLADEIEPLINWYRAERSGDTSGVSIYISGSETD